jgi:hypothetical protein
MNKFVQVRFDTTSNAEQTVNHDFRISKISYLRNDMFHNKFKNRYSTKNANAKSIKRAIKDSWHEYNELYKKKNKRNLQKGKQSDMLRGIITLSPIINQWLEDGTVTKDTLEKAFLTATNRIVTKIRNHFGDNGKAIKIYYLTIHYDEKTPHAHFSMSNHTADGQPVWHNLRRSGLDKYQDLVGEVFQELEIDLKRGVRKSTAKHMSVRQMHQEEAKQIKAEAEAEAQKYLEEAADDISTEYKKLYKLKDQKITEAKTEAKNALQRYLEDYETQYGHLEVEKTQLKEEIKTLQEQKKTIKADTELTAKNRKEELDKLDKEIKELRNSKKDIDTNLKKYQAKQEKEIEQYTKEVKESIATQEQRATDIIEDYIQNWSKFETIQQIRDEISELIQENNDLKNRIFRFEKHERRTKAKSIPTPPETKIRVEEPMRRSFPQPRM